MAAPLSVVLVLLLAVARAEVVTWVGGASNPFWDNPANWSPLKIPQPDDAVVLPTGSNASVATANAATAYSVLLHAGAALWIRGDQLNVGAGGFTALGDAQILLNSGSIVGGTLLLNDTSAVVATAGSLPAVVIGPAARVFASGPFGALNFTVHGQLVLQAPTQYYGDIVNRGGLVWYTGGGGNPNVNLDVVNDGPDARFVVNCSRGVTECGLSTLRAVGGSIDANLSFAYSFNGSGLALAGDLYGSLAGSVLYLADTVGPASSVRAPSVQLVRKNRLRAVSGNNVVLGGQLDVQQAQGLYVAFGDGASGTVSALQATNSYCQGAADVHVGAFSAQTAVVSLGCGLHADGVSVSFLNGNGTLSTRNATVTSLTVNATLDVAESLDLSGALVLVGQVRLGATATLTARTAGAVVSPLDPKQPGRLAVAAGGTLAAAAGARLVVSNVQFSGDGAHIAALGANATVDLQVLSVTAGEIRLQDATAAVRGEGAAVGWQRLVGPRPGARLAITADGSYEECTSPCPARPQRAYETLLVNVVN